MKLKPEADDLITMELNEECSAKVLDQAGFKKLMVFYKHGKPVWAHKDLVAPQPARSAPKNRKNRKNST